MGTVTANQDPLDRWPDIIWGIRDVPGHPDMRVFTTTARMTAEDFQAAVERARAMTRAPYQATDPHGSYAIPEHLTPHLIGATIPVSRELLDGDGPNQALYVPLHQRTRNRLRSWTWQARTRVGEWIAGRRFDCDCEDR
jgi:hypothetical protein